MNIIKSILLSIVIAGCIISGVNAQQGFSACGTDVYGNGGIVSFTIGQADYVTTNGTGGVMTLGIQQPIEILILTGIEQTNISLNCAVYPNPAVDYIKLDINDQKVEGYSFMLLSAGGNILKQEKLNANSTTISISDYSNSIYFLKVYANGKEVKTFKIIKNK